jgi:hypothetical protein
MFSFQDAHALTEEEADKLRQIPMDTKSNDEANTWNLYIQKLIQSICLLPPSIHPKIATANPLLDQLQKAYNIPLMGHAELKTDEYRAVQQFSRILPTRVSYVNSPVNLELTKLFKGYNESNITNLSATQRKIMNYILDRQDNHSMLSLVANSSCPSMHSVVAKTFIPKGTSPLEYGGIHFTGGQMKSTDIAGAESSITWSVTEHYEESKSIYIQPLVASNYGRFINGVMTEDYRKANLTIMKVKDSEECIHIRFVANRNIDVGEHLLYWYGDQYSTDKFVSVDQFLQAILWKTV